MYSLVLFPAALRMVDIYPSFLVFSDSRAWRERVSEPSAYGGFAFSIYWQDLKKMNRIQSFLFQRFHTQEISFERFHAPEFSFERFHTVTDTTVQHDGTLEIHRGIVEPYLCASGHTSKEPLGA